VRNGVTVVDDYGHHPEEIRQTLRAAKSVWPDERLVVVFQPHRYTRTKFLQQEFFTAFYEADMLVLLDIYAAAEPPMPGVTTALLYDGIREHGQREVYYLQERTQVVPFLRQHLQEGAILLSLGAGDVWKTSRAFLETPEES
jgi:UDP-N-acetylmuramate--alanine ligase